VGDPGSDPLATSTDEELAAVAAREGSDGVAFTALVERFRDFATLELENIRLVKRCLGDPRA
jgi:hypothetical protein